jgi:hypothetical protein
VGTPPPARAIRRCTACEMCGRSTAPAPAPPSKVQPSRRCGRVRVRIQRKNK